MRSPSIAGPRTTASAHPNISACSSATCRQSLRSTSRRLATRPPAHSAFRSSRRSCAWASATRRLCARSKWAGGGRCSTSMVRTGSATNGALSPAGICARASRWRRGAEASWSRTRKPSMTTTRTSTAATRWSCRTVRTRPRIAAPTFCSDSDWSRAATSSSSAGSCPRTARTSCSTRFGCRASTYRSSSSAMLPTPRSTRRS